MKKYLKECNFTYLFVFEKDRKIFQWKNLIKNIHGKIFSKRNLNIPLGISVWPAVGKKVTYTRRLQKPLTDQ